VSDLKDTLKVNDVVQIDPNKAQNKMFAGAFMVVAKMQTWGVQGYVVDLGSKGLAYYRAGWDEIAFIGPAKWELFAKDEVGF